MNIEKLLYLWQMMQLSPHRVIGEARCEYPNSPKGFDGVPIPQREYEQSLFERGYRPARRHPVRTKYPDGSRTMGTRTVYDSFWVKDEFVTGDDEYFVVVENEITGGWELQEVLINGDYRVTSCNCEGSEVKDWFRAFMAQRDKEALAS